MYNDCAWLAAVVVVVLWCMQIYVAPCCSGGGAGVYTDCAWLPAVVEQDKGEDGQNMTAQTGQYGQESWGQEC